MTGIARGRMRTRIDGIRGSTWASSAAPCCCAWTKAAGAPAGSGVRSSVRQPSLPIRRPERRLAFGDVKEVRGRAEDRLCAIEPIERLGKVPRFLKLYPLGGELARRGAALGVGHGRLGVLGVRDGRVEQRADQREVYTVRGGELSST